MRQPGRRRLPRRSCAVPSGWSTSGSGTRPRGSSSPSGGGAPGSTTSSDAWPRSQPRCVVARRKSARIASSGSSQSAYTGGVAPRTRLLASLGAPTAHSRCAAGAALSRAATLAAASTPEGGLEVWVSCVCLAGVPPHLASQACSPAPSVPRAARPSSPHPGTLLAPRPALGSYTPGAPRIAQARKARKLRRKAEELRAHRAVRIIQKRWLTYKILSLQKYAQGLLSKRSRKGKWQERFFYIHKGNLAYLPKRKLPQPKAEAAMRKATLRWDETGAPPAKARVLDDVRQIRADAAEREFEVIMASGQRHSYRAANEFDMRLWKGVFDKFIRYHDLYGPGGKSASSVAEVASRVAPGRQPRGGVQGGESRAEGRRPPPPAAR
mmetsp:Transcript_14490/g.44168  ORF Transcript_14490/g.44168 Transcript_14490/m.44168 type:complete len:381 (-) Transcript_14490:74-1216(-)